MLVATVVAAWMASAANKARYDMWKEGWGTAALKTSDYGCLWRFRTFGQQQQAAEHLEGRHRSSPDDDVAYRGEMLNYVKTKIQAVYPKKYFSRVIGCEMKIDFWRRNWASLTACCFDAS